MPEPLARVAGFPTAAGPLDLDVHPGEVVLLQGPNGCGKTSLLRALAGLPAPLAPASAAVAGDDPASLPARELAARVRAAWQDPRESLVGLTVHGEFALRGLDPPAAATALADRDVATLSSGEARRVALAVAGASAAPLLLLDEPTEGLDAGGRGRLLALVAAARERGAVVAAGHDPLLAQAATRAVRLAPDPPPAASALPPPGTAPLVEADRRTVQRGGAPVATPALSLPAGLHAVTGRNGSGKSTLLLRLAGLLDPGGVTVAGAPPEPGRTARLLLPHAGDLLSRATAGDELDGHDPLGLVPDALRGRHPLALSAGEAQRVALAKALGRPAPLYLLDEPEARLDAAGRAALLAAIARRVAEGSCVVAATHDEALAAAAHTRTRLEAQ